MRMFYSFAVFSGKKEPTIAPFDGQLSTQPLLVVQTLLQLLANELLPLNDFVRR